MTSVNKRSIDDLMPNAKELKNTMGIGPGSYSPKVFSKEAAYKNMRAPPFNCQDNKWSPERLAIKKNVPGPGAYNIVGEMNKGKGNTFAMASDFQLINFSNYPYKLGTYSISDPNNAANRIRYFANSVKKDKYSLTDK